MCNSARLIVVSVIGAVVSFSVVGMESAAGSPNCPPATIEDTGLAHLSESALHEDDAIAGAARSRLREAGQKGLDALFDVFPHLSADATTPALPTDDATLRWIEAVEAVSRQKDAAFSRLYWYTDMDEAIAAASQSNRPILSLRLLGNLDEDRSCANSRYFRTVLYADPAVASYLRKNYVLHWKSVRPVPHITIDMGDGRKIERTITGNSVHYVLDSQGRVVDVLPGLWAADAFLKVLRESHAFVSRLEASSIDGGARYMNVDSGGITHYIPSDPSLGPPRAVSRRARTTALTEAAIAAMRRDPARTGEGNERPLYSNAPAFDLSKGLGESRMRDAAGGSGRGGGGRGAGLFGPADEAPPEPLALDLDVLAEAYPAALSGASRAIMWQKRFGSLADPDNGDQQAIMQELIASFERSLAMDSVLARFEARPRALRWIAEARSVIDLDDFNARVYSELFLSPLDDPWLGLVPPNAYSALESEGLHDAGQ